MKKISAVIIVVCMLFSMFAVPAFASGSNLEELLGKLQTLVTEGTSDTDLAVSSAKDGELSAKELYDMTAPCVVEIMVYDEDDYALASGSGFFINDHGDLLTNYHVIEDGYSAQIQLQNGDVYDVEYVLAYDWNIDLAVLRVNLTGNDYIPLAKEAASTGDTIYTLGSALGLTGTFSDGLVSTASRVIDGVDYIQITAPISNGNSGGPLINSRGEAIGVNTWMNPQGQNVNFAVNVQELTNLDFTTPLTMRAVYEKEADHRAAALEYGTNDQNIQEWMADSDLVEAESNDELEDADILPNDYWLSGYIDGTEDFDCFGIILSEDAEVGVVIATYYPEDCDYLLAALVDEEGNFIDYAETEEYEEMYFEYLDADLEEGIYYLILCVSDDYPYEEPAFYQVSAYWGEEK